MMTCPLLTLLFLVAAMMRIEAVEIVAHRGASHDAPENTLAAFHLAWKQNADAGEIDVWLSKDGKVVALHDATTERTAGIRKHVSEQSLEELRALDAGNWKGSKWQGEKIPTLTEALETLPDGKRFFIEIKDGVGILPELTRVIRSSGKKPEQLPIIALSLQVARQAKAMLPDHEVSYLYDWQKDLDSGKALSPENLIALAKSAKLDGLSVKYSGPVQRVYVDAVKAAGLKFYVWTVDDVKTARRMAGCRCGRSISADEAGKKAKLTEKESCRSPGQSSTKCHQARVS